MDPYTNWSATLKSFHDHFRRDLGRLIQAPESLKRKSPKPLLRSTAQYLSYLHTHHTIEDRRIFPFLTRKMDVSGFAKDHKQLEKIMEKIEQTCEEQKKKGEKCQEEETFDVDGFTKLLKELRDLVFPHMQLEEDLTAPEKMKSLFSPEEMRLMLS
ncbi:hypothetical protein SpCBS45565_g01897 [Spizellomyces sp. 'palustris']|nr:hypothetical protein SpCBS45565_g01897 [Spizellomyces sp. 'palustris']